MSYCCSRCHSFLQSVWLYWTLFQGTWKRNLKPKFQSERRNKVFLPWYINGISLLKITPFLLYYIKKTPRGILDNHLGKYFSYMRWAALPRKERKIYRENRGEINYDFRKKNSVHKKPVIFVHFTLRWLNDIRLSFNSRNS